MRKGHSLSLLQSIYNILVFIPLRSLWLPSLLVLSIIIVCYFWRGRWSEEGECSSFVEILFVISTLWIILTLTLSEGTLSHGSLKCLGPWSLVLDRVLLGHPASLANEPWANNTPKHTHTDTLLFWHTHTLVKTCTSQPAAF